MGKYKKGSRITCLEELVRQDIVFFSDKVLHRSFFQSWQIRYAVFQIEHGTLFRAEKTDDAATTKKSFGVRR